MRKFSDTKKKRKFSDRIKLSLKKHQSPKYLKELKYEQIQDQVDENKMKKDNITDPIEQYDTHDLGYPIEWDMYDRMQTWVRDHFEQIRNREDLLDKADITVRDYLFSVFPNYKQAFPLLNKGITESKIAKPIEYVEPTSLTDRLLRFRKEHKAEYISSFITIGKHEIQLDLVEGCEYGKGYIYFIKNSDNQKIKTKFSEKVPFNNLVYIEFIDDKNNESVLIEKITAPSNRNKPRRITSDEEIKSPSIDPNTVYNEKKYKCKFGYYEVVGKIQFNNVVEIYGKKPLGYKNLINPKIINEGVQDNIKKGFSKVVSNVSNAGGKVLDKGSKVVKNAASSVYKYADEKAKKYGGKLYNNLTGKDFSVLDFGKGGILFDFGDDDKIGLEYKFKISKNNCQLSNKNTQYETYFYGIDNIINYDDVKKALGLGNKKGDSENCLFAIPNKTYQYPNDDNKDSFYIIKRKIYQKAVFSLSKEVGEEILNTNTKKENTNTEKEKDDTKEQQKNEFRKMTSDELKEYMVIEHPKFGFGKIISIRDDNEAITVRFNTEGTKELMLKQNKLRIE